ncbi:hypothetical protein DFH29DRAFT_1084350 [Suillus ampliporus]|nr:hypothetical protein DFH29DRAFT_1084350 [Suillus ampliporus]
MLFAKSRRPILALAEKSKLVVTVQKVKTARTFLHRDVAVTFSLLRRPLEPSPDPLDAHRRKWDILRITLESTVFSSALDLGILPQPLRESLLLSPQSFISDLHVRSLTLFTPSSLPRKSTSVFLPLQVLITLVASTLKIDCPDIGRDIYRGLELYLALEAQHGRVQESTRRETPKPEFLPPLYKYLPPRSPSPASSSSSSSLSTTSTRTAVPASPSKTTRQQSASSTSAVSDVTVTRSPRHRHDQNTPRGSPSASRIRTSRITRVLSIDNSLPLRSPQHLSHSSVLFQNISQLTE